MNMLLGRVKLIYPLLNGLYSASGDVSKILNGGFWPHPACRQGRSSANCLRCQSYKYGALHTEEIYETKAYLGKKLCDRNSVAAFEV